MAKRAKSSNKSSKAKTRKSPRPLKSAAKPGAARSKAAKTRKANVGKAVTKANVMPCLTYREAQAAVEFLCKAFGFKKKMVVEGDGGSIAHAELTLGNAMVMLGSHQDTAYGKLVTTPR